MKTAILGKQRIPDTLKEAMIESMIEEEWGVPDVGSDFASLILRLTTGGLLAGHGSQKLFGWFSGPGLKGTAGWLESLGLKPGKRWATLASASEFGGGMLTALGLFSPLGPLATMGAMITAAGKVHWGKPIWVTTGGAELPITNLAVALALTLTGPGRFSLDRLLGIRLPRGLVIASAIVEAALIAGSMMRRPTPETSPEAERPTTTTVEESQEAGKL